MKERENYMKKQLRNKYLILFVMLCFAIGLLSACAPKIYQTVKDTTTEEIAKKTKDDVFNVVSTVLVNQGFDLKLTNKDISAITTEFKKFGTYGMKPAFDYFL